MSFPGTHFVYDSISLIPEIKNECSLKVVTCFSSDNVGVMLETGSSRQLTGSVNNGVENRTFHIELVKKQTTICGLLARATTYAGIYFVQGTKTSGFPGLDFDTETLPSVLYGTKIEFVHVNAFLEHRKILQFVKEEICRTRQMLLNGLLSLASDMDTSNLYVGTGQMTTGQMTGLYKNCLSPLDWHQRDSQCVKPFSY